jgi:yecA family protein
MNVEALDGFFAALIAGPETVMPSEYYPEVFGGEISDACEFGSLDEANEILGLMMRHWNDIAGTLFQGEAYVPLLLEDENGTAHGNDWARGFMRGMGMRHDGWAELVNDEEHGGCLIPMMMLCHEHDEDPEMRPEPMSPEKHEASSITVYDTILDCLAVFDSTALPSVPLLPFKLASSPEYRLSATMGEMSSRICSSRFCGTVRTR